MIVLELRNVFPAVADRALLELLTKLKKLKHLFWARKICRKHTVVRTQRQIARQVCISQRFVNRVVKKDLFDMHEES